MAKWTRLFYTPNKPLLDGRYITCCDEHIALSLQAAEEGMVLLKNEEELLPLKKGTKVALFGKGTFDYVKGGGGSGDVYTKYLRNIYEGFKETGMVTVYEPLCDFYKEDVEKQYKAGEAPGLLVEPEISDELVKAARCNADVAVITISRFSGEGWDRSTVEADSDKVNMWASPDDDGSYESMPKKCGRLFPKGDFFLSPNEERMVEKVKASFDKVVVVLNVGGVVDTSWFKDVDNIKGALLAWQGGMEGGLAAARLLTGLSNPSGKLPDTFARTLNDYPSTEHFHDSHEYVNYSEDIYVGYRYFETLQDAASKVVYPFGYGLSYTDFMLETTDVWEDDENIEIFVKVTNIGKYAGKEVVQVYYDAPNGKIKTAAKNLVSFAKTPMLNPGESRTVSIEFKKAAMASYDDLGKIQKSAWVLEKGDYNLYVGTSVRDALMLDEPLTIKENTVVEQLSSKLAPTSLKERLLSDGTMEVLPTGTPNDPDECAFEKMIPGEEEVLVPRQVARDRYYLVRPYEGKKLQDVVDGKLTLDEFMDQLSDDNLISLLGGQPNTGVCNTWGIGNLPEYGVPNAMTADGPAGVRIAPEIGVCTTAWPCATLVASTWNTDIIEKIGEAAGAELKENNLAMWLAPAINIHRNPMCGRNFEYYSEDPLLTGKMAAAIVRGIQTNHVSACVKHFAANNKEVNRKHCDSRVSERALREIYLKGFEIAVKEGNPWALMSAYNVVNGHRASECKDLLEGILRDEWGFDGLVISDWWGRGEHYKEILAGNDVKMATGFPERVKKALDMGLITREDLVRSAKRVMELLIKLD